jgi:Holliday junction resolvasome RuvABC ATP-dependent DNA helicase subunit
MSVIFRNQKKILKELEYIKEAIKIGENVNILLLAPSGYGKTTLAHLFLEEFETDKYPSVSYSNPPNFRYWIDGRFIFIDEAHELPMPEMVYPLLDSGKYTFIIATNESGLLKEPLINRCIPLIFENYDVSDLTLIAKDTFGEDQIPPDAILEKLVEASAGNPRELKIFCRRIQLIEKTRHLGSEEEYLEIMEKVLNISTKGLNYLERKYLDFLEAAGGSCSLNLLVNGANIDERTIRRDVEPRLVGRRIIRITHRGRELL